MRLSFTKYTSLNWALITLLLYNMALNLKGLSDLNPIALIVFFFVMYRKYYIVLPEKMQRIMFQKRKEYLRKQKALEDSNVDNAT